MITSQLYAMHREQKQVEPIKTFIEFQAFLKEVATKERPPLDMWDWAKQTEPAVATNFFRNMLNRSALKQEIRQKTFEWIKENNPKSWKQVTAYMICQTNTEALNIEADCPNPDLHDILDAVGTVVTERITSWEEENVKLKAAIEQ